jgi:ankyrin repeat protein
MLSNTIKKIALILLLAVAINHMKNPQLLLATLYVYEAEKKETTPYLQAIINEDAKEIAHLLTKRIDSNECNDKGQTPLMIASLKGNLKIMKLLLDASADKETSDIYGNTAIFMVLFNEKAHPAALKLLLNYHANIHVYNHQGHSPLILACLNNHKSCLKLLLQAGAGIEARGKEGTPLNYAAYNGSTDAVKELIKQKADLEARDGWSLTPLLATVLQNDAATTRLLLKGGDDAKAYTTQDLEAHSTLQGDTNGNKHIPMGSNALDLAKLFNYKAIQKILQKN